MDISEWYKSIRKCKFFDQPSKTNLKQEIKNAKNVKNTENRYSNLTLSTNKKYWKDNFTYNFILTLILILILTCNIFVMCFVLHA